jgi:DNA-binding transcriptional LysR family regulator
MQVLHGAILRRNMGGGQGSYHMNFGTFDLNLLVVFEAVLRERSVSKAGVRLGLSQPAVSHALNRLRWMLKDQLFIRTPDGMLPTSRAEELAEGVRRVLTELQSVLEPEEFIAEHAERCFRIAVNNYAAVALVGPITARCVALAPNVRMLLRPSGTLDLPHWLDHGELAIASLDAPATRFASQVLIKDDYVAAMRRDHPVAKSNLDLKTLAGLPHLVISSSGEDLQFVDDRLAAQGYARKVALEAPYLSAGAILTQSDMVAVLGRQIAHEFRRAYAIELKDLPFESPVLRSVMLWHRRFDNQTAHRWLRQTIESAAGHLRS